MTNKGMLSVAEVAELLDAMQDAEGVAFLCAMHDVRGVHHDSFADYGCRCPVARLAHIATGNDRVWVSRLEIDGRRGDCAYLPPHATAFIAQYDHGAWPELEEAP